MENVAEILPYAVAVALSPMPIAALILMLLSEKAKTNSIAFTLGWILGLAIMVFVASSIFGASESEVKTVTHFSFKTLIELFLGTLLLGLALVQWRKRTKPGQTPSMPKWMSAIESFSPIKSFAVGISIAIINVKNAPMGIAVGSVVSNTGNDGPTVFIAYLLLATSTITIPTIGFLVFGKRLQGDLENLKTWLILNNATIMFVLFLILGMVLISKSLESI